MLDTLGIGGAEQLVLSLCKGLNPEIFHVVVCTLFSRDPKLPEPLADEIRSLGIHVEQLSMQRWRDRTAIARFLRLIDKDDIDIVHSHMVPANFWGSLLAKLFRNRLTAYTCHEPFLQKGLTMRLQQTALNIFLTNRVISISDMTTRFVRNVCHAPAYKIVKIPNAVDTDRFNPSVSGRYVREAMGIPEHVPVIGNVGRYTPEKGYSFFLETAALIRQTHPEARFLIAGHVPEHNYLRNLSKKLGLQDRLIFAGPRRDIPEVMGAIDIFLFTSIWGEGFGISLIEAMASGKSIIAANVGATREIIDDRVTGLLPSPKVWMPETDRLNVAALAEAADFLLQNPDVRQQLGHEARRQAVKRFSMPSWIKSIEDLYCNMIKDHN